MASAHRGPLHLYEPRVASCQPFGLEHGIRDVPPRFREEQARSGLRRPGHFLEEQRGVRQLMYHGEDQREVHRRGEVRKTHRIGRCEARVQAIENAGFARAAPQPIQHAGLNVHCDHPPRFAHQASQLQSEEAHPRARFEHGHARANVRGHHFGRLREEPPHGTRQQVAQPPRADVSAACRNLACFLLRVSTAEPASKFQLQSASATIYDMIRAKSQLMPYQTCFSDGEHEGISDTTTDKGGRTFRLPATRLARGGAGHLCEHDRTHVCGAPRNPSARRNCECKPRQRRRRGCVPI